MCQYSGIKAGDCRLHDGTERESDSCQEGSGLPRSPHRKSQGATSVYRLVALPLYKPETGPVTKNMADMALYFNKEQMGQRKHGLSLLCCGNIGIMTVLRSMCMWVGVCVCPRFLSTPSVILFL